MYQSRWIEFVQSIVGPKRLIVLKPRQAGFSTLVSAFFTHKMMTQKQFKGIIMADQYSRTEDIMGIYQTFIKNVPDELTPAIAKMNTEEILFSERLNSGFKASTANDPNSGRAGTRSFSHQSEAAFYRYALEIDEGIQNSIPLADDTYVIKESTANGRSGIGKHFYDLWNAAKRGESIYKPFFVAWYEVDDYALKPGDDFKPTAYEKELLKMVPTITEANLMWRRLKVMEYSGDEESLLSPEERFKQDFPVTDEEAFLSTGMPVFDPHQVQKVINRLNNHRPPERQDSIKLPLLMNQFKQGLKLYHPPRSGRVYYIGADVAEGLGHGDASSCFVMDHEYSQVARWHGKIDPDLFGLLLIEMGEMYNTALIIPENNNMGHTTVTTIRKEGYPRLFKTVTEDKVTREKSTKFGWTTSAKSKDDMLNEAVARIRHADVRILDVRLPEQMGEVARGENGRVDIGGKDRVVAFCLALMGRRQYKPPQSVLHGNVVRDVKINTSKGNDYD